MLFERDGRQVHHRRSRTAHQRPRQGPGRGVLHAQAARQGRGALRQEVRRGGGRDGARARSARIASGSSREAADLLYHLLVVLHARGVTLPRSRSCSKRAPSNPASKRRPRGRANEPVDGTAHRRRPLALPHLHARGMGGVARRHADDADAGRGQPAALAARPARHEGGRGHLSAAVAAAVALCRGDAAAVHRAQQRFLGSEEAKVPYIIGVAGSVAVGKSTTARVLQALLARWPNVPKVDLVTTDGFLLPNAVLEREGLMEKKGFPESYDLPALLLFPVRREGRAPAGARAGLFASGLRRDAEPVGRGRPAGHPDRRRAQRAADRPPAEGRQGHSVRVGLLRLLGLSRRRRRACCSTGTSTAS